MAGSAALNEGDCDSSGWLCRVPASVQLIRPQRDQRQMGDRKGLLEHGSHVTSPIKPRFTEEMFLYLLTLYFDRGKAGVSPIIGTEGYVRNALTVGWRDQRSRCPSRGRF